MAVRVASSSKIWIGNDLKLIIFNQLYQIVRHSNDFFSGEHLLIHDVSVGSADHYFDNNQYILADVPNRTKLCSISLESLCHSEKYSKALHSSYAYVYLGCRVQANCIFQWQL